MEEKNEGMRNVKKKERRKRKREGSKEREKEVKYQQEGVWDELQHQLLQHQRESEESWDQGNRDSAK